MEKIWLKSYAPTIAKEIDMNRYKSIAQILDLSFERFALKPAFSNMGTTLTYHQLDVASKKFASYLQNDLKLKKGDRVALMMPNILQYPVCLFGVLRAGLIAVNINPLYTPRELEHQLNDSKAQAIVIFANSAHVLEKALPHTPDLKHIMVTEIGDFLKFPKSMIVNFVLKHVKKMVPAWSIPKARALNPIIAQANPETFKPVDLTHDDLAFLQYTGGTTGVSKGAQLSHGNIVANMLQAKEWIQTQLVEGQEVVITPLPLYHIFSLTANCFCFSTLGGHNILITNPRDIPGFVKELKKCKFTAFTGVNTLFNGLLNNSDFKDVDFSHLKLTLGGGMAVQKQTAQRWKEVTGKPLIEAYGLTETSPAVCINPLDLQDYNGKIGLPISSTIVAILDDQGKEVALGEVGEISVKGPQVMKGYWNRPEETAKVMTADGFFRTGDLGFMDEEGYVRLVDRKKDMILVSGFNVFPNEVEDVVCSHPKVFECAAIGVPDERTGEAIKLFVVKKDQSLSEEELKKFCRENMTNYKVPKIIAFKTDLPKSNVGKILRKDLRNLEEKSHEARPN